MIFFSQSVLDFFSRISQVTLNMKPNLFSKSPNNWAHDLYLKKTHIIKGRVERAGVDEVVLADDRHVSFEYLVVCSGVQYTCPPHIFDGRDSQRFITRYSAEEIKGHAKLITSAKKLIVVGVGKWRPCWQLDLWNIFCSLYRGQ